MTVNSTLSAFLILGSATLTAPQPTPSEGIPASTHDELSFDKSPFDKPSFKYDVSSQYPFGSLNPKASAEVADFAQLIGESSCQSVKRLDQNNWAEPVAMLWRFKYIMNGMAVQDETLKKDDVHSGSIRQWDAASKQWQVHFYSMGATTGNLPFWTGARVNQDLVFNRQQTAPNGMEGVFRLTFSDITDHGFNWIGAWVSEDESTVYPTWRITCKK